MQIRDYIRKYLQNSETFRGSSLDKCLQSTSDSGKLISYSTSQKFGHTLIDKLSYFDKVWAPVTQYFILKNCISSTESTVGSVPFEELRQVGGSQVVESFESDDEEFEVSTLGNGRASGGFEGRG